MAKLICSKEYLDNLISHKIVEPRGNGKFNIITKPNLVGESFNIPIEYVDEETIVDEEASKTKSTKITKSIEDWYKEYRLCFPTNILEEIGKSGEGSSLRRGNKKTIIKRIKERINDGYDMDSLIKAAKFEVWMRKEQSKKTGENKLEFMKRMEAWINDTENIDTMIERMTASKEFQLHLDGKSEGPARKINLY